MSPSIFNYFFNNLEIKPIQRNFAPQYLLSEEHHKFYIKNGYVVIKNCVSAEHVSYMQEVFNKMSDMEGFKMEDAFVNSGRFESTDIRNYIVSEIKKTSADILSTIANTQNCEINTGGSFQIKPPSKNSALNPHQDSPIIDETTFYATYVWIPLCDMTEKNGALSILPGSHLWGNHQRSLNVPWIYEKYTKLLWKYVQPVYVNKGDIICFDSATIHASNPNLSNELRLAYTGTLLPKNFQLVHYFKDALTPKGKVEKYFVDEHFYSSCNIMERPAPPYILSELEDWVGNAKINRSIIKKNIHLIPEN